VSEALDHAANRGRAPLAPAERGSHAVSIETARDGTQRRAIVALSHDATLDVGRYTAPGWTAELLAGRSRGLQALSAGRAEPEP